MRRNLDLFVVPPDARVSQVIKCIDENAEGIALVLDDDGKLVSTVTDGDVRRALLSGISLDSSVEELAARGKLPPHDAHPVVAHETATKQELLRLMTSYEIRQIPILDDHGHVIDLALIHEVSDVLEKPLDAVVMAGGSGTRLLPLTETTPKPLLPIGDKPVMERIIEQLRDAGINKVNLAVHHMAEKIEEHFGDGKHLGVELNYVDEEHPLGTAGALRHLEQAGETILVINADIVTKVNYRAMLAYHREHRADLTVAVRRYDVAVPYGVLKCEGVKVKSLTEKPVNSLLVNAGIYLMQADTVEQIPKDRSFHMTDLMQALIDAGRDVVAFPVHEYWLDIGRVDDYSLAQEAARTGLLG